MEKEPIQNNTTPNQTNATQTPWDALVLNSEGPNQKAEYLNATRKEEYLNSEKGQKELSVENDFDRIVDEFDQMVERGQMTREEANKLSEVLLDMRVGEIDAIRQEEYDRQRQESRQRLASVFGQIANQKNATESESQAQLENSQNQEQPEKQLEQQSTDQFEEEWDGADGMYDDGPLTISFTRPSEKQKVETTGTDDIVIDSDSTSDPVSVITGANDTQKADTLTRTEATTEEKPVDTIIDVDAAGTLEQSTSPVRHTEAYDEATEIQDEITRTSEEIKQLKAELEQGYRELAELRRKRLVGIDADFSYDREAITRDKAADAYGSEKAEAGFFKRIRMNFFENYYKKKYAKEIESGERKIKVDGKEMTLDEALQDRSEGAIGRFVSSVVEGDMGQLYKEDGETRKFDPATTEAVRSAILEYANKRGDGADEKIFKQQLRKKLEGLQSGSNETSHFNNYFEIAERAIEIKDMARGTMSLEQVLEDFKVYNANVRESYQSEKHRENIQNILATLKHNGYRVVIDSDNLAAAAESATKSSEPEAQPDIQPETQPNVDNYYDSYKAIIGEDGASFFNSSEEVNSELSKAFGEWWNSLSDEGRRVAFDLAVAQPDPSGGKGNAVKMWIRFNTANLPPTPNA